MDRAYWDRSLCLALPRRQTLYLLDSGCIKECLKVLMELLFPRGRRLGASLEEYDRCGEVLGGRFGNSEDHVWFEDRWMVSSLCDE
jgi:hypothetical protein